MCWSNSDGKSKSYIELSRKNLFLAEFVNLSVPSENDGNIRFIVKKIDAPSININLERAYASNYVHMFQQGEIHWEPINVTFVDAIDSTNTQVPQWRNLFENYLSFGKIIGENRTGMLDHPRFCDEIKIKNYQSMANLAEPFVKEWSILRPRLTKISFGSYDYGSDDANEISITFIPEWCEVTS
jgi:hypothetical protein